MLCTTNLVSKQPLNLLAVILCSTQAKLQFDEEIYFSKFVSFCLKLWCDYFMKELEYPRMTLEADISHKCFHPCYIISLL